MQKVIDAEFEVVGGPLRVGDEHPTVKGWYWTGRYDRKGVGLWYKPPGLISRWVRKIALWLYLAMMAIGMGAAFLFDNPTGAGW